MDAKEIEVDCPCCATRLTVDVLTRTVLRAVAPAELDETGRPRVDSGRWSSASERVDKRASEAKDKLDAALSYEKGKEAHLDDLFEKARKKLERREGEDGT